MFLVVKIMALLLMSNEADCLTAYALSDRTHRFHYRSANADAGDQLAYVRPHIERMGSRACRTFSVRPGSCYNAHRGSLR
jgi:hypothetical protein